MTAAAMTAAMEPGDHGTGDDGTGDDGSASPAPHHRHEWMAELQEVITVVLLSVTALFTAWSGYESSQWGGESSLAFGQSTAARIEASRYASDADIKQSTQVSLFTAWVQATGQGDQPVADFLASRFPSPLDTAFQDWLATKPLQTPSAPNSPFDMPSYQLPERAQASAADATAATKTTQALLYDQRSDRYTILTVLFAAVLFFGAITTRIRSLNARWVILGIAIALFLVGAGSLVALPKLM